MNKRLLLFLITTCLLLSACRSLIPKDIKYNNELREPETNDSLNKPENLENAENIISDRTAEVIKALKDKNMAKLSGYIHPEKGVRFSPYSHINVDRDLIFTSAKIKDFLNDKTKYEWGSYDGSGEPIVLTPEEYYNRFIYSKDFASASQIGYNKIMKETGLQENQFEVYPDSIIVEYYFPGFEPKYQGMDWESLRLVFQKHNGTWYLVGIIHNQWTI